MAQWTVKDRSATIKLECLAFGISQTCYRYKAKLDAENGVIADRLVRLTNNQRNWASGDSEQTKASIKTVVDRNSNIVALQIVQTDFRTNIHDTVHFYSE